MTIEIAGCKGCGAAVLNPRGGNCPNCGREIYPVSFMADDGTAIVPSADSIGADLGARVRFSESGLILSESGLILVEPQPGGGS